MGTSQRRERERERRRQQILIAARRVLVENGYGNTTMGNIAKEAELSTGTLYLYFDSKEELLASLPVRTLQYLLIRMEHTNEEVGASAVERLESLKNCFLGTYDFDPLVLINMFKLQSSETLQHISYELLTEITDLARKILGKTIGVLSTSLNEEAFAAHWEAQNQIAFENPPTIDETVLQRYAGSYNITAFDSPISFFVEHGLLMAHLPDRIVQLRPVNETLFVIDADTRFGFPNVFVDDHPLGVMFHRSDGTMVFGERIEE